MLRGLGRLGDLRGVDVDADDVTLGRGESEMERQHTVAATDFEHVPRRRNLGLDGGKRTPPPTQPRVQARRPRRVGEEFHRPGRHRGEFIKLPSARRTSRA